MKDRLHPRFQLLSATTVCAIRSATVGTPRILVPPPCGFGISTARTGGGKYVPDDIRFQILYRLSFRSARILDGLPVHPRRALVRLDPLCTPPTPDCLESQTTCPSDPTCPLVSSQTDSAARLLERTNPSMSRPLRSTPITGASPLLRAGPPARRRIGTQRPPVSAVRRAPSRHPRHAPNSARRQYRHRPSHVPCRSRRPGSRRLHAGHHLANKRAPARLIPETLDLSGFDANSCFDTSTAVRSRSPSRSPPDASPGAFSSSLTTTVFSQRSMRWFDASPEGRRRRATTFITCTAPHQEGLPTHRLPSALVAHSRSSSGARWSGGSCLVARRGSQARHQPRG